MHRILSSLRFSRRAYTTSRKYPENIAKYCEALEYSNYKPQIDWRYPNAHRTYRGRLAAHYYERTKGLGQFPLDDIVNHGYYNTDACYSWDCEMLFTIARKQKGLLWRLANAGRLEDINQRSRYPCNGALPFSTSSIEECSYAFFYFLLFACIILAGRGF